VALVVMLACAQSSCALTAPLRAHFVRLPATCPDRLPPQVLTGLCPHGVCGFSCLPDRWQAAPRK
jgi:hypothetical protein